MHIEMSSMKIIERAVLVGLGLGVVVFTGCSDHSSLSSSEIALHQKSLENFTHPERWKDSIEAFTEQDRNQPPSENVVLFVGSSSIVGWDTKTWFPEIETINRGFGGSHINDSTYYAERIIIPYAPRAIVFYAGDNDAAGGKTPEMIFADFKAFSLKIRRALPKTKLIYISIKPSIARWGIWPQMQEANKLIGRYCKQQKNMSFVDVSTVMLDISGTPIRDIFFSDGLHMNEKGYELWTSLVRPLIEE